MHFVKTCTGLSEVGKEVAESRVAQQKYVIRKSLTKSPSEYPDKKSQPHVQVFVT